MPFFVNNLQKFATEKYEVILLEGSSILSPIFGLTPQQIQRI
jgi:hypothetical protein